MPGLQPAGTPSPPHPGHHQRGGGGVHQGQAWPAAPGQAAGRGAVQGHPPAEVSYGPPGEGLVIVLPPLPRATCSMNDVHVKFIFCLLMHTCPACTDTGKSVFGQLLGACTCSHRVYMYMCTRTCSIVA